MTPPAGINRISTHADAVAHAHHLLDPHRLHPVVVVTTPHQQPPLIDVDHIARELEGVAEVALLPTGPLTRAVQSILPAGTHVYGGAGRLYPPATDWHTNPAVIPLRFCYQPREARQAAELLIADALRAHQHQTTSPPPPPEHVRGTVATVIPPDRALVRLEDGRAVMVRTSEITAQHAADQLLAPGMTVTGTLSRDGRELAPEVEMVTPAQALAGLQCGHVTLAQVQRAYTRDAVVSLFPGAHTRIARPDGVRAGDVLAVEIEATGRSDGQGWVLHPVPDVPPEGLRPSPSIVAGGPPWLMPPPARQTSAEAPEPARDVPECSPRPEGDNERRLRGPVPGPVGDSLLRAELVQVRRELADSVRDRTALRDERRGLLEELDDLARENARLRAARDRARDRVVPIGRRTAPAAPEPDDSGLFLDPADQLRFEVQLAWARRIPAAEKAERPLPAYDIGEEFIASLEQTGGVDRAKVVDVIVEVLTGLADVMPGRELHRLREGPTGGAVTHPELGTAWRASIQVKTASARRLHFWRAPHDGRVTFANVGLHDDMSISA